MAASTSSMLRIRPIVPSLHGSIDCADSLEHHRGAGGERVAVRPFLRRVALARAAWREDHGRGADARHESGVMSGTAREFARAQSEPLRGAPKLCAQNGIAGCRRTVGE